ncbi:unnamed protein product, partial [Rotaria socialis]
MKSKDIQKLVLSKYENGDGPTKIFRDLNGTLSLPTIERWCKSIRDTGCINLSKPPGRPRTIRTNANIQKVKHRLERRRTVSSRKLSREFGISRMSVRRVLKNDLGLHAYKVQNEPMLTDEHKEKRIQFANWIRTNFRKEDTMKILFSDEKMFDIDGVYNSQNDRIWANEPMLTDEHKEKRIQFANWIRTNFRKEDTMKILFSDEKMFDIDGVYNSQNDRIWAVNRSEADIKGGTRQKRKFPQKVMIWLRVCSKGVSPLIFFEKGTVDHDRYIKEVLPVALKFGNDMFGNDWIFQQDGAKPHTHAKSQEWCTKNFPSFIDKSHWPPNSPDLNPLDYCIWNEFAQVIEWDAVTSKTTLITALKRAVRKISQDV